MSPLLPEEFERDVSVRVACGDQEIWLSERLLLRLGLIGAAYELHLCPLIREDAVINFVQAEALSAELEFVGALVADDALGSLLERLVPFVILARRREDNITFEWP